MTIESTTQSVTRNGNDVVTSFSFPFTIWTSEDLTVVHVDADGNETTLSEGETSTTYSVTVSSYPGAGSITYPASGGTPLATGASLIISRELALTQTYDLENQGGYNSENQEIAFDKAVARDQQLYEMLSRALTLPKGSGASGAIGAPLTAGGYLKIADDGLSVEAAALATTDGTASSSTPQNISTSAAAAGASANYSRADHVHLLSVAANVASILAAADYAAIRTLLSLVPGTDVLAPSGDGSGLSGVMIVGTHSIYIPAGSMRAQATAPAAVGTAELTTNKQNIGYLAFDAAADEFADFSLVLPKSWDGGTLTATFYWSHAAASTYDVIWSIRARAYANGDGLDQAWGTAVPVTDSGGTTNAIYSSSATAAITPAGSPDGNQFVMFEVSRDADNVSDTLNVDARLHGVLLTYTIDAGDDS